MWPPTKSISLCRANQIINLYRSLSISKCFQMRYLNASSMIFLVDHPMPVQSRILSRCHSVLNLKTTQVSNSLFSHENTVEESPPLTFNQFNGALLSALLMELPCAVNHHHHYNPNTSTSYFTSFSADIRPLKLLAYRLPHHADSSRCLAGHSKGLTVQIWRTRDVRYCSFTDAWQA